MKRLLAAIPFVAFAYVLIGQPVLERLLPGPLNHKVVWPALFLLTIILAVIYRKELDLQRFKEPPLSLLLIFLCFAGASVFWAFSPPEAFKRWIAAAMAVTTIILPLTMREPKAQTLDRLFWIYVVAIFINAIFVLSEPSDGARGHTGYFYHKQYLGMCVSVAILLAGYMIAWRHRYIVPALITMAVSIWLIVEADSRAAMGFAILAPIIAFVTFIFGRQTKLSLGLVVSIIPISFMAFSLFVPNLAERLSFHVFGDPTFTGRTLIWDWVETQAAMKPWFGWGFHSFWFVPNSPSFTAPGFVSEMPSAHSGYLDLRLETGYIGIGLFLAYVVATLNALGRFGQDNPGRMFCFLSLYIYIMMMNLMESLWFTLFDPLWLLFLFLSASSLQREKAPHLVSPISEPEQSRKHRFPHSTIGAPRPKTRTHSLLA
ncbi:MAG: O-antigen ligase family protein [Hyphomicrobiaceae bacterium]|nr:O-antigen ligase family protein [Hyphomicrobiaceae bacterium]MCC0011225.1 O-antigen ligase family protein [Hyphomicrobiaceae bacterium]